MTTRCRLVLKEAAGNPGQSCLPVASATSWLLVPRAFALNSLGLGGPGAPPTLWRPRPQHPHRGPAQQAGSALWGSLTLGPNLGLTQKVALPPLPSGSTWVPALPEGHPGHGHQEGRAEPAGIASVWGLTALDLLPSASVLTGSRDPPVTLTCSRSRGRQCALSHL